MRAWDLGATRQVPTRFDTGSVGARVFNSGSFYFVYGLDNHYGHRNVLPDTRLRQFKRNALLADLMSNH
jgi:hypothetical protein